MTRPVSMRLLSEPTISSSIEQNPETGPFQIVVTGLIYAQLCGDHFEARFLVRPYPVDNITA